jgi:dienelactone hydrolase
MGKKILKIFLYTALGIVVLLTIAFILVYQEFGPIDQEKLIEQKIRQNNLVADFIYPKDSNRLPLIIALAGSGGGFLPDMEMQTLALHGYAVLSVAYFRAEGLPNTLENIPLEYFGNAIQWAVSQKQVDTTKIILLGVSRGAELVLLLASHYPQVKGVIAYAPGCFVLPNAVDTEDSIATHSSWTWQGNPLSFAPLKVLQEDNQEVISYRHYIEPLLKDPNNEAYTIKIENAKCPILLLSGEDDQTWPSVEMANLIEQRLKSKQYPYQVRHITFPDAGHWLVQFRSNYQLISSSFFRIVGLTIRNKQYKFNNGGSIWATIIARRKAREDVLQYLEQYK